MTPTQVYNQLVAHHIFYGYTIRQANMFAVRRTWYYFNSQLEFKQLTKDLP